MPGLDLAHEYATQLRTTTPFTRVREGVLHLLPPVPGHTEDQHRSALDSLVRRGTLQEYRYIDAKPQAAILAICA